MGSCSSVSKPGLEKVNVISICNYARKTSVSIKIKEKSSINPEIKEVELVLTRPMHTEINLIRHNSLRMWLSNCILPGQDPHGQYFQKCLDNTMHLQDENTTLLALFDGHGPEGEKVVRFCCSFTSKFFRNEKNLLKTAPVAFLTNLTEECDLAIRGPESEVNTDYSGTTAVFVLILENMIYTACIGDSRAVIASYLKKDPLFPRVSREENNALAQIKRRRNSKLEKAVHCLQLTKDHKPNNKEELARIVESGGRVKRLLDYEGNRIGPYRLWEADSNVPGLTMSRSIGDNIGKNIGVIATPDTFTYKIDEANDLFLVIGSDGIWDAMDNEDVINFVEFYREKSCRVIKNHKDDPCLLNSCIAQLLCEEARIRWLTIVEEDNVSIDDISCIVLEINKGNEMIRLNERKSMVVPDPKEIYNEHMNNEPQINNVRVKDPRRGSQLNFAPSELIPKLN